MRMSLSAALLLALLPLLPTAAAAERVERDYDETFDVAPGARLDLRHGDGDVRIEPWERDAVQIVVRYRADVGGVGMSSRRDFEVEFRQTGDTIRVIGHEPSVSGIGFFHHRQYEYVYSIKAPAWLELQLEGEDGDVEISGWRGRIEGRFEDGDVRLSDVKASRVELELEDGDLTIDGIEAVLDLESEDGLIEIEDCRTASARIRTQDGDVILRRCEGSFEIGGDDGEVIARALRASRLDVRTSDGDVELELLASADLDLTLGTEDGNIELRLADGTSADVDVRTGDGRIRLDLADADLSRSRRRVSGKLGAGGGRIRISTDDGDITLSGG